MNESTSIILNALQILEVIGDVITVMLPWMILAAIRHVRQSVESASAYRTRETKAVLNAMKQLHNDLLELGGRGDEIEP